MELMKHICPDSPYVWNQEGVSECFDNLVLGLGVNIVTMVMIAVPGITTRHQKERRRIHLSAKILFYLLPALGLCFAFFDVAVLIRRRLNAYHVAYHEWLFSLSQFSFWVIVILVAKSENRLVVLCNRILCFWWIAKLFLLIPRLQIVFSSPGVLRWLKESCVAITDILFGILINIIRIKWAAHGSSSMEESLLPCKMEVKEDCWTDLGIVGNVWHIMTFKSIDPVMQRGMKKQLDFEDLLQLPSDMDPSSCHNILLSCWNAQRTNTAAHPSLFKAIYSAYGWPYFCLGLLKVWYWYAAFLWSFSKVIEKENTKQVTPARLLPRKDFTDGSNELLGF